MTEAEASDRPTLLGDAFACPRCNAFAHQTWFDARYWTRSSWEDIVDSHEAQVVMTNGGPVSTGRGAPPGQAGTWRIARCSKCDEFSVWRDDVMMYPRSSTAPMPHEDMPADAKVLYNEARDVVGLSPRAGAALARATLEKLLKGLDPDAGKVDLATRIDRMLPNVSEPLGEMLTVIRHTGNKSLHVEDDPDDAVILLLDPDQTEIVELIFESINDLVEERITKPKKVRAVYERVPERIRDMVGKKTPATERPLGEAPTAG